MPMLRRGYGAVRNLRCKSGARFPPSTVRDIMGDTRSSDYGPHWWETFWDYDLRGPQR